MTPVVHWPQEDLCTASADVISKAGEIAEGGFPSWILDIGRSKTRFTESIQIAQDSSIDLLVAIKGNGEKRILAEAAAAGVGFDVSNLAELEKIRKLRHSRDLLVSLTSPALPSYEWQGICNAIELGSITHAHWDSLDQLEKACRSMPGTSVGVRIAASDCVDAENVDGVFQFTRFGIKLSELPEAAKLARKYGCSIEALHAHNASGLHSNSWYTSAVETLARAASESDIHPSVNLGGGLRCADGFDLKSLLLNISAASEGVNKIMIEPGRWWSRGCVWLLSEILEVKSSPICDYVVIDAGAENHRRWSAPTPPVFGPSGTASDVQKPYVICGRTCSERDYFVQVAPTAGYGQPKVGDWVALEMGGYSLEMENYFGGLSPLPRVFVE
ncbi:hypothetical protein [Streptomyces atratus]|uniref:hypothetical protein n=1 Tax=Streptomyces atratus TaxID=1893 RepID=UPI00378EC398